MSKLTAVTVHLRPDELTALRRDAEGSLSAHVRLLIQRGGGYMWQPLAARGNPTFGAKPAPPSNRCRCDQFVGDGIDKCETCGLPLMERGE